MSMDEATVSVTHFLFCGPVVPFPGSFGNRCSAAITRAWIFRNSPFVCSVFSKLGIFFSSVCDPSAHEDTKDECND